MSDKVLDKNCQQFSDPKGVHDRDHSGDINLVSGIPWPVFALEPKWYRFRICNTAVARPFIVQIKDSNLADVHQSICFIIGTEGGYLNAPIRVPIEGIVIGVAERFDIVCDFTSLKSRTLFLWNRYDKKIELDAPMFCYSHLLARLLLVSSLILIILF